MQFTPTFYGLWFLAFLGFPIGGLLAQILIGPVNSVPRALLAGLVTGAVVGLAQWLVLQRVLPIDPTWVAATAVGLGVGLAGAVLIFGTAMDGNALLLRGLIAGFAIGLLQWLLLRQHLPASFAWVIVLTIGWAVGWFVTRAAGVNLTPQWTVFGATGALTFQFITLLALRFFIA
jgi:hypothetical protein